MRGLFIRSLEIVDEDNRIVHRLKDVPIKKGLHTALALVQEKDGDKSLYKIMSGYFRNIDEKLKDYLQIAEDKNERR